MSQVKQRTLKKNFILNGVGLHTGKDITVNFLPAPENHGIKIKRIDLETEVIIPALAEYVTGTQRGTVLSKGNVQISTVEHAMAALYAMGIDNCLIEVDAPEFPILDGSSCDYVNAINKVGSEEQNSYKDFYIVRRKMEVCDPETGAKLTLLPDETFSINSFIEFESQLIHNQSASIENMNDFAKEIAPARTFVFVRDIAQLLKAGLIQGGNLENAVVIYETEMPQKDLDELADLLGVPHQNAKELGYLNKESILFQNEPARHKLLDIIGDMALVGKPIKGRIIATRPGHKINNLLARTLRKDIRLNEVQPPVYDVSKEPLMDINEIRSLIPHRYPFLLVDKIIEKTDKYIVGVKKITTNEPFFVGHFPDEPIMPGVLQVEAMAQTSESGGVCSPEFTRNAWVKK